MGLKRQIIIAMLISVIITVSGLLIRSDNFIRNTYISYVDVRTICFSVGTSLLATTVFAFFSIRTKTKEETRVELLEKMGFINFYIEREDITERCTYLFSKAEIIDITAIRLKTLLEKHEERLTNLLKTKNVRIRILMPDPDSNSSKTIEELLGTKESIRAGLRNVLDWQKKLKSEKLIGSLEIRYSDKLISSMYQRIDNVVFTGPYMSKKESQCTFTIECDAFGEYGKILSNYFDVRFSEALLDIKKRPFVVEFLGMPGAGKTTCVNLLKKKYPEIISHCNEDVPCYPEDTPFVFNDRLVESLSKKIQALSPDDVLFLDRGTEDLKIWLKTHLDLKNITREQFKTLNDIIPKIPQNLKHYKVLFIMNPALSKKRRPIMRRIDEWAIKDEPLNLLYKLYKKRGNSGITVINATQPLREMENKVIQIVNKIFEEENNKY